MQFLLVLAVGAGLYYALKGPSGADCIDEGINPEAAKHLLLLLDEPHTRAELDAAEVLLASTPNPRQPSGFGFPRAEACVRAKRGSDE